MPQRPCPTHAFSQTNVARTDYYIMPVFVFALIYFDKTVINLSVFLSFSKSWSKHWSLPHFKKFPFGSIQVLEVLVMLSVSEPFVDSLVNEAHMPTQTHTKMDLNLICIFHYYYFVHEHLPSLYGASACMLNIFNKGYSP